MPDLLIRNLSPQTIAFLKEAAARHGRSVQAEVTALIEDAEQRVRRERDFWAAADPFRVSLQGRPHSDSAGLIRQDRDSGHERPA